jgi:hypothetical protein
MSSKEFLAKLKSHAEAWNEVKDAKQSGGFVEVPEGKYTIRLRAMVVDVTDDQAKVPFVQFDMVVVAGEHEGSMVRKRVRIEKRGGIIKNGERKGEKWEQTIQDCLQEIARDLKGFNVETDDLEIADLPDVADDLSESQPACRVEVKDRNGYLNVRIGKPVEDDDLPSIDDILGDAKQPSKKEKEDEDEEEDEDEGEEESSESDESDEESDDESDDDDDEDIVAPVKGETVTAKPKGTQKFEKFEVQTVNKSSQTCTLKRKQDGKVFKDVSWDVID